jgi:hypothetical protein
MPRSIVEGNLEGEGYKLRCAVLNNGTQVITQGSLKKMLAKIWPNRGTLLENLLPEKRLLRYMDVNSRKIFDMQIKFKNVKGESRLAYKAEIVLALCKVYSAARSADALTHDELYVAKLLRVISAKIAPKGIETTINDVTGYSPFVSLILEQKIKEQKIFPDLYYSEIYRLKKMKQPQGSQRAKWFSQITTKLIYEAMCPELSKILERKNPIINKKTGMRRYRHHQFLDPVRLNNHLNKIIGLMLGSDDWKGFMLLFEKMCQRSNEYTLALNTRANLRLVK